MKKPKLTNTKKPSSPAVMSPDSATRSLSPFWLLFGFFLLLTVVKIVISLLFVSPQVFEDELVYSTIARQVYTGTLLTSAAPYPPGPFPPGYGFVASLAYLLSPDRYIAYHLMLMINAVLTSLVLFPAYFLLKPVVPRTVALCGALLTALMPSVSMNTFLVMSEAFFIPLFIFSIWFVYRSLSEEGPSFWDLLTGLSLFLLFFTRAAGWSMVAALAVTILWMTWRGHFRADGRLLRKTLLYILPVLFLSLVWAADQILTKGSVPAGYSLSRYAGQVTDVLIESPGHLGYVILLHIDYLILGSFLILPFLAICAVFRIRGGSWSGLFASKDATLPEPLEQYYPISIYAGISSILVFLFGIAHMIQFDPSEALCGRYVDPIVPVIVIAGIAGLSLVVRRMKAEMYLKWNAAYLLLVVILTALVMLPAAYEPNNNAGIFYLYSLTSVYVLPLLALITGIFFTIAVWLVIRKGSGIIPLIILLLLITTLSTIPILLWEVNTSAKSGSLLPFCHDVSLLCSQSGITFWDTSSEEDEWDRIVFYTMKFWLGDRILEKKDENISSGIGKKRWLVTRKTGGDPVITFGRYRVVSCDTP